MIICHSRRLIFIKTRKTAGSSIEIALSRLCDDNDIVTKLSVERGEEDLRKAEGGNGPVNHLKGLREYCTLKEWRRLLLKGKRAERPEHATAAEVRKLVGDDVWNNYLKVTVERNPWDRALSRYWWQKQRWEEKGRDNFPGLSDYLEWLKHNKPHWLTNWGHYSIGGSVAVDKVLFYESLGSDLVDLAETIGVNSDLLSLPKKRAKSGFRKDDSGHKKALSEKDCKLIEDVCVNEIHEFGYKF